MICDLVKFYEGGVSYQDAKKMPFSELVLLQQEANRINKAIESS